MGRPKGSGVVPIEERFWARVNKNTDTGCWLWTGPVNKNTGYGQISKAGHNGKRLYVHRLSYILEHGEIFERDIDHMCHTIECGKSGPECIHRRCVNPNHLMASSHKDNIMRTATNANKTHCPQGHSYAENTILEKNKLGNYIRRCRLCRNERARLYRKRENERKIDSLNPKQ